MAIVTTPNMALPVPSVGIEPGPQYATDVNTCLNIVDAHDHSPGSGTFITPTGISIDSDLPFNSQNAISLRSVRLDPQVANLSLPTDLGCLYEVGVDLYYNDGNGNQIRVTQAGGVVGSPGNIVNLTPPASVVYVGASSTFVFQSNSLTAASLDGGSVVLRNLVASSPGLTLSPPTLVADYNIILPQLPVSNLPLSINASGIMSAAPITFNQLDSGLQSRINTTPTIQKFTGGAGTYTTPTSPAPLYIKVKMVGAGGGGSAAANGGSGTDSTFGTALLVAGGGIGGQQPLGPGGDGGSASLGAATGLAILGTKGGCGIYFPGALTSGGSGAPSFFGGGSGNTFPGQSGTAGAPNSGAGGSGGSSTSTSIVGAGGGSGGYVEATIGSPSATYSYSVGTGGTAGSGSGSISFGGAGANGLIIVEEYYC